MKEIKMEVIHHEPHGRASRIVEYNNVLYFEIHAPVVTNSNKTSIYEQAKALLVRLDELLTEYGSDKKHVLRVEIILKNAEDLDEFNVAWSEWILNGFQPARYTHTGLISTNSALLGIVLTAVRKEQ